VANQATSDARGDGLRLTCTYISAVNRCAPPGNAPTPQERDTCLPFLEREILALARLRVIMVMGAFAWDGALWALAALGHPTKPKPRFGHAAEVEIDAFTLVGCFHPSQQNTFTGRLTPSMLDDVVSRALDLAGCPRV
jgi:uracil-DNA glycosylase family 4